MRYLLILSFSVLLFTTGCHKCQTCEQYCMYCETSTGLRHKVCATEYRNQYQVDSIKTAFTLQGYNCSKLTDKRDVCDNSNKVNDAVNYYTKQDYYCYPKE